MPRYQIDSGESTPEVPGWIPVNLKPVPADDPTKEARLATERAVTELLQCDHVVVLTGLGTSLCIKDPDHKERPLFPTMASLWERVSAEVEKETFREVQDEVGFARGANLETLLSRCQMKLGLAPDEEVPRVPAVQKATAEEEPKSAIGKFVKTAEGIIRTECGKDLEKASTETHEDFLRRLVRRGPRRPRVNLFTTNYDLCFETAAARIGLPVIDGFAFSAPPRFQPEVFDYDIVTSSSYSKEPDLVPRLLRLFKLHGSVDWHPQDGAIIKKLGTKSPILIYPRVGKYASSYSPPFLEIMSRLQGLLRQRSLGVLSVCCGLNDLHIAEPILSAVKANSSLRLVVLAPDLSDAGARSLCKDERAEGAVKINTTLRQLNLLINNGDNRLTFINGFFPDLVKLMPELGAQTDAEQHEARIKKLEAEMADLKKKQEGQL